MAIEDLKITQYQDNVKDLPDTMIGQAQTVKAILDGRTDKEIKIKFNGLIDHIVALFCTKALADEKIAKAVFNSGAADMTQYQFVIPGTSLIKDTCVPKATQAEAEAGDSDLVFMTPKSVHQAIAKKKTPRRLATYTYTVVDSTHATASLTDTIAPGEILEIPVPASMYVQGETETPVTAVNITLSFGAPVAGFENIYQIYLNTGTVVPTITWPTGITLKWSAVFSAQANKYYEFNTSYGLNAYRTAWVPFV